MEKTEDIQFHPCNTVFLFFFTAVKYSFFKMGIIFNIFLYFITWHIIKIGIHLYCNIYLLLITFTKSLDPDQAHQNVGPDLDPN